MGHGTCILPRQRLVLGRGHVSEIAASISKTCRSARTKTLTPWRPPRSPPNSPKSTVVRRVSDVLAHSAVTLYQQFFDPGWRARRFVTRIDAKSGVGFRGCWRRYVTCQLIRLRRSRCIGSVVSVMQSECRQSTGVFDAKIIF